MLNETPLASPPLFDLFWEQHRQKIVLVSAALLFIGIAIGGLLLISRSHRIASENLFSQSSDMVGWEKVVSSYPRSGAAANAMLLIAAAQREAHDLAASNKTYTQFLEKFPHHPLAITAMIGHALNADTAGDSRQALDQLQQASVAYPKSYGAPFALWMRARILARTGQSEEAKKTVQMISTQYPDSFINQMLLQQGGR